MKIEFKNKIQKIVGAIEFKNIIDSNTLEMNIYGDIVSDEVYKFSDMDICPKDILNELDNIGNKNLEININSCGGSVFAGIGIYNAIKQKCKGNITVNITGIGASIASVIAMCGNTINMGVGSQLMIHKPSCGCIGNANDFTQMINTLNKVEESIIDIYMENVNEDVTRKQIESLMENESYLSTTDCKNLFKNIVIIGTNNSLANSIENKCDEQDKSNEENKYDEQNQSNEENRCNENNTSEDECKKEKDKEDKIKNLVNFEKELTIFLCQKLN